jgi:hypothetical protein
VIKCNHCNELKDESEFNWRYKKLGKRQRTCRECQAGQKKQWYEKHGDKHRARVRENNQRYKETAQRYVWDYLSTHPCVDCGETDPVVLEFDHVRGKKRASIARMVSNLYSVDSIKKEIAKCEVRCANCHRRRTSKRKGWFRG